MALGGGLFEHGPRRDVVLRPAGAFRIHDAKLKLRLGGIGVCRFRQHRPGLGRIFQRAGGAAGPLEDPAQARAMLAKAADANSAEAQFQLGVMYAEGTGGPKDDVAARAMFEKAAAQGHAEALDWLGSFVLSGRGGPQDTKAAKGYYEKAAALGNEDAKAALKRLECSLIIKDRRGNVVGNLCF